MCFMNAGSCNWEFSYKCLGEFVYHPIVFPNFDYYHFGSPAREQRTLSPHQNYRETITAKLPMSARDFESSTFCFGKKLFHCLGIEGSTNSIAQLHHSVLYIANLTRI